MKKEIVNPASLVAVTLFGDTHLLAAAITSRTLEGMPTIEVKEYEQANFCLALDQRVFIAPNGFNFRTKLLALLPETADLSDVDLAAYLIHSEQTGATLADGKMLLQNQTLEQQVAQITRLPNDAVALTEMPRPELTTVINKLSEMYVPIGMTDDKREALTERIPPIVAETSLRAAFRAYLVESRPVDNNLITVFVMATENGFAFGFWNASWGLFNELGESMPEEFSTDELIFDSEDAAEIRNNSLAGFFKYALENAFRSANDMVVEKGFGGIERIVFAVPLYCLKLSETIVEEFKESERVEVMLVPEEIENQILRGLLYSQIEINPLAEANLSRDLYVRLIDNSIAEEQQKKQRQAEKTRRALTALFVPAFLLAGFIFGSLLYQFVASVTLSSRNTAADREAARLKPVLDARNSYIPNFSYRESYINQTLGKKDQQTIAISFLPEVDKKYTLASTDRNFSLSNIKLENTGLFEMKGIAVNEDMVTNFVRGLEFAASEKDEKRIFSNLTFEVRRGTKEKQSVNPNFKSAFAAIPPGSIGWLIKGSYAPLAAIAVPVKTNQPPPIQNAAPNTGPNPTPIPVPSAAPQPVK